MSVSNEKKGMAEQFKDSAGSYLNSLISFPDTTEPPNFLKDHISVPTWQKTARIGFDILMVGAGFLLIYLLSKTMSISDPAIMSLMPMIAGLAISGFGLKFLIEDLLGKENARTAAKVAAVLMPFLLIGSIAALMGAGLHSAMGGFGFNAYFMAGIVMIPLVLIAIKHSASVFKETNGTYIHRRAALPPPRVQSIPNPDDPFANIRPLD